MPGQFGAGPSGLEGQKARGTTEGYGRPRNGLGVNRASMRSLGAGERVRESMIAWAFVFVFCFCLCFCPCFASSALSLNWSENVPRTGLLRGLPWPSVVQSAVAVGFLFRGLRFRGSADLLVEDRVTVELKASRTLDANHEAQLINHLRATSIEVGLLLHFGPKPSFRRLILTNDQKPYFALRGPACPSAVVAEEGDEG